MGRKWTAEQRKAASERAKAAIQATKNTIEPSMEIPQESDMNVLSRRLDEAMQLINQLKGQTQSQPQAQNISQRTVITKYSFNPKDYPDPRDRFFAEPRLTLKGFNRDWFDMSWKVARVNYEQDGIKYAAPRFELELYGVLEDEEGLPSNKRYTIRKAMFFEDPDSYLEVAAQKNMEIPESLEKVFMDEMRYLQMLEWLLENFYPAKPVQPKKNKSEAVIGNRLVEVFEINSENSEVMPFDQLKTKL